MSPFVLILDKKEKIVTQDSRETEGTPVQVKWRHSVVGDYQSVLARDVRPQQVATIQQAGTNVDGVGPVRQVNLYDIVGVRLLLRRGRHGLNKQESSKKEKNVLYQEYSTQC